MAKEYDSSIKIDTQIETKNLNSQMLKVANSIKTAEAEVNRLQHKLDALGKQKIPTHAYKELEKELKRTVEKFGEAEDSVMGFERRKADKDFPPLFQARAEAQDLSVKIDEIKAKMQSLESMGSAFTSGANTEEYAKTVRQVEKLNAQINVSNKKLDEMARKQAPVKQTFESITKVVKNLHGILRSLDSSVKKVFGSITNHSNRAGKAVDRANYSFKKMLISSLAFSTLFRGISSVSKWMAEGFANLTLHSDEYAASVQSLKNALATLGNSFASAFSPIIQAAIPYLVQLINWVNAAVNAIAQLFAYLTGKTTFKKATEVQNGYNDALNDTAGAAKKAYGALAKFDDLDVLQKQDNAGGGSAGGGGSTGGFEEVPIDSEIKAFGDKLKDLLSKLFAPFKEAWDREGQFVMDAWKYALEEVWELVKSIGRDFLEVWNQEATIAMLADILHIIGDIGLIVGNLARNFREAWEANDTGLHILENIRDIFAAIIKNIREAADATVIWSDNLDFSPLLEAVERFTEALIPMFDALSGILTDFYTQVLLPLGKWVLEKGLPDLLDILTAFVDGVEWDTLRQNFSDLWDSLGPFAQRVLEGLNQVLEKLLGFIKEILNSEGFAELLDKIAVWMDGITAEDAANAIEMLIKALIGFRLAIVALDAVIAVSKVVPFIEGLSRIFTGTGITAAIAGFAKTAPAAIKSAISTIITTLSTSMALEGASLPQLLLNLIWVPIKTFFTVTLPAKIGALAATVGTAISGSFSTVYSIFSSFNPGMIGEMGMKIESLLEGTVFDARSWEGVPGKVYGAIDKAMTSIIDFIGQGILAVFDAIGQLITGTFNWDETLAVFSEAGAYFEKAFNGEEIGKNIVLGLAMGIRGALSFLLEPINDLVMTLTNGVCELLGIHSPSTVFAEIGRYLIEGLLLGIQEMWLLLQEWFMTTFENLILFFTEKWTAIKDGAVEIWTLLKDSLLETWENIKEAASEKFDAVKEKLEEVWNSIKDNISLKIVEIKNKIDEFLNKAIDFKDQASKAFNTVKENIINALTPIIDKIKEFIDWVRDAIEAVKDFFSSGYEQVGTSAAKTSKGSMARSFMAMDTASAQTAIDSLPHLASGAVIRGGKPFAAILGDQPIGQTNVETPLPLLEQAVDNVMGRRGYDSVGSAININLNYDGETFARLSLKDIFAEAARQGYDVDLLGWQG